MSFRALLIMAFCNIAWALNVVVSKLAITDFSAPPLFYALVRRLSGVPMTGKKDGSTALEDQEAQP